jgi:hypothetical protein
MTHYTSEAPLEVDFFCKPLATSQVGRSPGGPFASVVTRVFGIRTGFLADSENAVVGRPMQNFYSAKDSSPLSSVRPPAYCKRVSSS